MATTIITKDKIITNAYNNIHSFIDDRSKVADPRSPNSTTNNRQFVYDTDPLSKGLNFGDYPYIILEFPNIIQSNISSNGKIKRITWTQSLTVRAIRDGAVNSGSGRGKTDVLNIGDDLFSLFNTETNKQALRLLSMYDMKLEKLNSDNVIIDSSTLYEDTYELTYETRLQVTD